MADSPDIHDLNTRVHAFFDMCLMLGYPPDVIVQEMLSATYSRHAGFYGDEATLGFAESLAAGMRAVHERERRPKLTVVK